MSLQPVHLSCPELVNVPVFILKVNVKVGMVFPVVPTGTAFARLAE